MAFQFITEGLPYPSALVFFYIEGLGFVFAMMFFYYIFVKSGRPIYLDIYNKFETPVIDRGYNEKVVNVTIGLSRVFKRAHSGDLNTYLLWLFSGLLIVILWMVLQL